MNAFILPCFMVRDREHRHSIYVEEPIEIEGDDDAAVIQKQAAAYIQLLEKYIARQPNQWLWQNKRWKYSWTRHVVVLSDGKPGHFKQTQNVAELFSKIKTYHDREGLKFETTTLEIRYRSKLAAKMLMMFGWVLLPIIRGRLGLLKWFLAEESVLALQKTQADLILTAGSSMAPVQHLFAAETGAKKIVLMKPSFPYNWLNYDLAIVPEHDEGTMPEHHFRTLISPSGYSAGSFDEEASLLRSEIVGAEKPFVAVFVGGKTHHFDFSMAQAEALWDGLERATQRQGGFLMTTSRRTSQGVEKYLKRQTEKKSACRKLVIANEDARSFIAKGMMGLAEKLIVTEDSLAMISEAVATGKPVIVLQSASGLLPEKHRRFLNQLIEKKWVRAGGIGDLERLLTETVTSSTLQSVADEKEALVQALRKLL